MTLLTTHEVAERWGMDYEAARKRLYRAQVQPARIIQRAYLYDLEDIAPFDPAS